MKLMLLPVVAAFFTLQVGCAPQSQPRAFLTASRGLGPYSGAVVAGNFCFVSGKIGNPQTSFEQQVRDALAAVEADLAAAELTLADVVSVTVYLTDLDNYAAFNGIYAEILHEPYPARACVEVSALPASAQVEISVIAHRKVHE